LFDATKKLKIDTTSKVNDRLSERIYKLTFSIVYSIGWDWRVYFESLDDTGFWNLFESRDPAFLGSLISQSKEAMIVPDYELEAMEQAALPNETEAFIMKHIEEMLC